MIFSNITKIILGNFFCLKWWNQMQKNGNKKELHKCINDFWHKTHFFLCYNAYFFLVNNIKSVSVIYPTKKNIGKNSWHFFRFVNVLVSTKNQRSHRKKQNVASSFFSATQLSFSQNVVAIRTQKHVQIGALDSAPVVENFDKKNHFLLAKPMHLLQWRLHPLRCLKLICVCGQSWNFCFEPNGSSPHYVCNKDNRQVLAVVRSCFFCQMGVTICHCNYKDWTSGPQLLSFNWRFPFSCVLQECQARLTWQPANSTSIVENFICSNAIFCHFYGACEDVI